MRYISGAAALNTHQNDITCGDWHSYLKTRPEICESEDSPLGTWDIHPDTTDEWNGMPVAGHMRACLDLICSGKAFAAQGMRKDFICNEDLTPTILAATIYLMQNTDMTKEIDDFMAREYRIDWVWAKREAQANGQIPTDTISNSKVPKHGHEKATVDEGWKRPDPAIQ
jgi:hypothetical protein